MVILTIAVVFHDIKQSKKWSSVNRHYTSSYITKNQFNNLSFVSDERYGVVYKEINSLPCLGERSRDLLFTAVFTIINLIEEHFSRWKRYAKSSTPENETEPF
ncbi:hypothetical protein RF11_10738 [Thelohanellus kitauei]|uniref:Uncharacterized protein n=1 Tax=Thelohanellus kitauei TaxID=669202 RepID=A0A0C2N7L6_THEKT|nr:hypothetical protein RF11_10738 [Thelohanellus kitauei]